MVLQRLFCLLTPTPGNRASLSERKSLVMKSCEELFICHRPVPAQKLLDRIVWGKDDVDLWEVNEAFAVVPMAFMQDMGIPRDKINVHGGACALGHPIGASGARIIVTLLNAMERYDLKRGVAAICIGGGEGTAIAPKEDKHSFSGTSPKSSDLLLFNRASAHRTAPEG